MIHSSILTISAFIALLSLASAQVHATNGTNILGCSNVDCPTKDGYHYCDISDDTYLALGLAPIKNVPPALNGISLLKAVGAKETDAGNLQWSTDYYLDLPPEIQQTDLNGCVLFPKDPLSRKFPDADGPNGGQEDATGTCPDVIDQACIDGIIKRAEEFKYTESGMTCNDLASDLGNNPIGACANFSTNGGIGSIDAQKLPVSMVSLSKGGNGDSECWPAMGEEDTLTKINWGVGEINRTQESLQAKIWELSPVITVFVPNMETAENASAQMTCIKAVGGDAWVYLDTVEKIEGAAPLTRFNPLTVGLVVLAAVAFGL